MFSSADEGIFSEKERKRERERIDGKYGNLTENQEMTRLVNVIKDNASKKLRKRETAGTQRRKEKPVCH